MNTFIIIFRHLDDDLIQSDLQLESKVKVT